MPTFAGVNHFALSVTDLDRSTRFYTEVLGLVAVLDFGYGRVCLDRRSGFSVGLVHHPGSTLEPFSELNPGLDHLGLTAESRDELVSWQERLEALGVPHSPIQDTELGHHLNFRDPDGIALELQAPREVYRQIVAQLRGGQVPDEVLLAQAAQILGAQLVVGADVG
ncbi:VOC family protein [uncultured Friedmanniella sp.]|uniref:VOC family protein n=1 Tax=uncultured Friedmanniella sp. TaxID=335381 RepID=UPI0035CACA69